MYQFRDPGLIVYEVLVDDDLFEVLRYTDFIKSFKCFKAIRATLLTEDTNDPT